MKIVEIFKSVQGEGIRVGQPCIFIRFHGCNLQCPWCDTKYALDGDYNEIPINNIYNIIKELPVPPTVVCLTGGEPLVQDHEELGTLCEYLKWSDFEIHVETNGLVMPSEKLLQLVDLWTISPKINEYAELYSVTKASFCTEVRYSNTINIKQLQVKFVVKNEDDVIQIKKWLADWDPLIVIQPERYTFEELGGQRLIYLEKMKRLIVWCDKHLAGYNYRVLPQLHYLLWQGKRGV